MSSVPMPKTETKQGAKPSIEKSQTQRKKYSISKGYSDPFFNSKGDIDIQRPDLNIIRESAEQSYNFNPDIDNSEEEDLDDEDLKVKIKNRKLNQRALRDQLNTTLEAVHQVQSDTEIVRDLIKVHSAIGSGVELNTLREKQENLRAMMNENFNDDQETQKLFLKMRKMQLQDQIEKEMVRFTTQEQNLRESLKQTEFSETYSNINDVLTPKLGARLQQLQEIQSPGSDLLANAFQESMHPKVQVLYKQAQTKNDLIIQEESSQQNILEKFNQNQALVEDNQINFQDEEASDQESDQYLEQQLQLLESIISEHKEIYSLQKPPPDEVENPNPKWPPENNSSVGMQLPQFKASFIGHLYEVKAKRDLYPERLRQFNMKKITNSDIINQLYLMTKIYDKIYKVRTEKSQPVSKSPSHFASKIVIQQPILEQNLSSWHPISVKKIDVLTPVTQEKEVIGGKSFIHYLSGNQLTENASLAITIVGSNHHESDCSEAHQLYQQNSSQQILDYPNDSTAHLNRNLEKKRVNKALSQEEELRKLNVDQHINSPSPQETSGEMEKYEQILTSGTISPNMPATADLEYLNRGKFDQSQNLQHTPGRNHQHNDSKWPSTDFQPQQFQIQDQDQYKENLKQIKIDLNRKSIQEQEQINKKSQRNEISQQQTKRKMLVQQQQFDFTQIASNSGKNFQEIQKFLQSSDRSKNRETIAQLQIIKRIIESSVKQQQILQEPNMTSSSFINASMQTHSHQSTQQSFNLLSEISKKRNNPRKGLALKDQCLGGQIQVNQDGLIFVGEINNNQMIDAQEPLIRSGSASTIQELQSHQERAVGRSIQGSTIAPSQHSISQNASNVAFTPILNPKFSPVKIVTNKKGLTMPLITENPEKNNTISNFNLNVQSLNNLTFGEGIEPFGNRGFKHAEEGHNNTVVDNQKNIFQNAVRLSSNNIDVSKIYENLARMSMSSSGVISSGLQQFELFQQNYLKNNQIKETKMQKIYRGIPQQPVFFEPQQLEIRSVSKNEIQSKLKSTTLINSIQKQKIITMRKNQDIELHHEESKLSEPHASKITLNQKVKKQKPENVKFSPQIVTELDVREPAPTQMLTREPLIISPKQNIKLTGLNNNDTEAELNSVDMRAASQLENLLLAVNDSVPDLGEELVNVVLSREHVFKNLEKHKITKAEHTLANSGSPSLSRQPSFEENKQKKRKFQPRKFLKKNREIGKSFNKDIQFNHSQMGEFDKKQFDLQNKSQTLFLIQNSVVTAKQIDTIQSLVDENASGVQGTLSFIEGNEYQHLNTSLIQQETEQNTERGSTRFKALDQSIFRQQINPKHSLETKMSSEFRPRNQSIGKSTLMQGFYQESPLSMHPNIKTTSPFHQTMVKDSAEYLSIIAMEAKMPPIFTNLNKFISGKTAYPLKEQQLRESFVSARQPERSEQQKIIGNNFKVTIKQTRNEGNQTMTNRTIETNQKFFDFQAKANENFEKIQQKKQTFSKFEGFGTVPPFLNVLKPLKAGTSRFSMHQIANNAKFSLAQANVLNQNGQVSVRQTNNHKKIKKRLSPQISSGMVVLVEKFSDSQQLSKRFQSLDFPKNINAQNQKLVTDQSMSNLQTDNDERIQTMLRQSNELKHQIPIVQEKNIFANSSQHSLQKYYHTIDSQIQTKGGNVEELSDEVLDSEIQSRNQQKTSDLKQKEPISGQQTAALDPWHPSPYDFEVALNLNQVLNQKQNPLPQPVLYQSIWIDKERFTFDLKKKQNQNPKIDQSESTIQFKLEGTAPPIGKKKKK